MRALKRWLWKMSYLWRYRKYMRPVSKPPTTEQLARFFRDNTEVIARNVRVHNRLMEQLRETGRVTSDDYQRVRRDER